MASTKAKAPQRHPSYFVPGAENSGENYGGSSPKSPFSNSGSNSPKTPFSNSGSNNNNNHNNNGNNNASIASIVDKTMLSIGKELIMQSPDKTTFTSKLGELKENFVTIIDGTIAGMTQMGEEEYQETRKSLDGNKRNNRISRKNRKSHKNRKSRKSRR
jgi:hypothetical protein